MPSSMTTTPRQQAGRYAAPPPGKTASSRRPAASGSNNALWTMIVSVGAIQLFLLTSYNLVATPPPLPLSSSENHGHLPQPPSNINGRLSTNKAVSSFWWPSPESSGGLLSAIRRAQNPRDCSSRATRYFVMQSLEKNEEDNRGLSAWASSTMHHMLHAFSDGDRVLMADDKLWPMARGCQHGAETRECYFAPLTRCKLSDVDPIDATADGSAAVLARAKDEYDHSARTLYSSSTSKYPRMVEDKMKWSGLPPSVDGLRGGMSGQHSQTALTAAFLAYTLDPQPWLRKEIDSRLRHSIPTDLDPDRTVGVPIRRSDKCFGHDIQGSALGELDCPPLDEYLDAVRNFTYFDPQIENVIVTSEERSACDDFVKLLHKELPGLRVITNVGDVQQGTGSASKLESYEVGTNNADVVASALTSFHMHLRARYFVLTTKSSWTTSIAIFARVYGYASSSDVYVIDIGKNRNTYSDLARRSG